MLRQLPIDLMVDTIAITQATILYEEKVNTDRTAGNLMFEQLDLTLSTVGNMQPVDSLTSIRTHGKFKQGTIDTHWTFAVHDPTDTFRFTGSLKNLATNKINTFTQPNLNIGFEGIINKLYFDINGDNDRSETKMRMAYEDFEIEVMQKKNRGVNKFLSDVANLFVAKNSASSDDKYREGEGKSTRNKSKSFFHFLWISILWGLVDTVT